MYQLVLLSASALKVLVVLVAASGWVDACVVEILVALEFVKGLKHHLTVLSTYSAESVKKILIHLAALQEIAEA